MKVVMAESNEYFTIGSEVKCTTCYDQDIQGEVMAFDHQTNILAIKSPTKTGKSSNVDIHIVNLQLVKNINVINEGENKTPSPVPNLNLHKLNYRLTQSKNEKKRQVESVGENVTPEAQKLFLAITKTIDEVVWRNQNIIVMKQVEISPPYQPENCQCSLIGQQPPSSNEQTLEQTLNHVRKIVEKFHNDQQKALGQATQQVLPSTTVDNSQQPILQQQSPH